MHAREKLGIGTAARVDLEFVVVAGSTGEGTRAMIMPER